MEVVPEVAIGPPLPPLPRPIPAPVATKYVVPTWAPPKPCPSDEGWNGLDCVTVFCPAGEHFVQGKGCVAKNPERRMHIDVGPPFASNSAREAAQGVAYRHCLPRGDRSSYVVVWFRPVGDVDDVELRGPSSPSAEKCLRRTFARLRIPPFRGSRYPVVVP